MTIADERLTDAALATLALCQAADIARFVALGLIERGPVDGLFGRGDVTRVRLLLALAQSGIDLDQCGALVRDGRFSLRFAGQVMADPVGLTAETHGDAAAALGLEPHVAAGLRQALGLPEPALDEPIREDDRELMGILAAAMRRGVPREALLRVLRVFAMSIRQVVDVQRELFRQDVEERMLAAGMTRMQMMEAAAAARLELQALGNRTVYLLLRRYLEDSVHENIVSRLEEVLSEAGVTRARGTPDRTIAFLDLSGYTRLTEQAGDERAADAGGRLVEIAADACARHGGRVVKPLGDGAMLRFEDAGAGVASCLEVIAALAAAGLPAGRAGIAAGPVVTRDGEHYGRTVNLAARLADRARPGEVLVSAAVAEMAHGPALAFEDRGPQALKGFDAPVGAWRATAVTPPGGGHGIDTGNLGTNSNDAGPFSRRVG